MAYQLKLPGISFVGNGALSAAEDAVRALGKKAFVVTGKVVAKTGLSRKLTDLLDTWGISSVVFSEIAGEPTDKMVEFGVKAYRESGCDFIAGIGGGSPLDSAKAIAAMSVLPGAVSDYMGKDISDRLPPTLLIPTTAGTGSEATRFSVITDSEKNVKMLLRGDAFLPDVAVVDPSFTITAPPDITASTGMDALAHAVESYTSRRASPLTDPYALDAIKRVFSWLPVAYAEGKNRKAREEMAIAAYEAGICISNASVTLVHGMSRPLGALFHIPHGMSNAMLICECLAYVLDGAFARFADIAKAIGAARPDDPDQSAASTFVEALKALCKTLNIPTLKEYGINKADFDAAADKMASDAMASGSPSNTIKEITKKDLLAIYENLW